MTAYRLFRKEGKKKRTHASWGLQQLFFLVLRLAGKIRHARLYISARPLAVIYALPTFFVAFVAPQLYESALAR